MFFSLIIFLKNCLDASAVSLEITASYTATGASRQGPGNKLKIDENASLSCLVRSARSQTAAFFVPGVIGRVPCLTGEWKTEFGIQSKIQDTALKQHEKCSWIKKLKRWSELKRKKAIGTGALFFFPMLQLI